MEEKIKDLEKRAIDSYDCDVIRTYLSDLKTLLRGLSVSRMHIFKANKKEIIYFDVISQEKEIVDLKNSNKNFEKFNSITTGSGRIFIMGGMSVNNYLAMDCCYELNENELTVDEKTKMPTKRKDHALVCIKDRYIYVIGGSSNVCLDKVDVYDIETDSWNEVEKLEKACEMTSACAFDDRMIYVMPGHNSTSG
jgi:N-acetylneuraminic acid mutarotase